jgi:hypothetical protein
VGLSEVAASGGRAMRAARDLVPHLPKLLPGLHKTVEMFVRQLGSRWAMRLAESLAPSHHHQQQQQQQQQFGGQPGQYGQPHLQQPYSGQQQSFYGQQPLQGYGTSSGLEGAWGQQQQPAQKKRRQ